MSCIFIGFGFSSYSIFEKKKLAFPWSTKPFNLILPKQVVKTVFTETRELTVAAVKKRI